MPVRQNNKLEDIFLQNQLNKLINRRLKEIVEIQSSIELSNLDDSTSGNNYSFNMSSLRTLLLKNLYDGNLTPQDADVKQSIFATELKNKKTGRTSDRKIFFLETWGYCLIEGGEFLMRLGMVYFHTYTLMISKEH